MDTFHDKGTEDIFDGKSSKAARRTLPEDIWRKAARVMDAVLEAKSLGDLRFPYSRHLKALDAPRKGQHSVRINDQYRLCFAWTEEGARRLEIVDYHP